MGKNRNLRSQHHLEQGDEWSPCQPGEIGGVVRRLKVQRTRESIRQIALGVTSCGLLLFAGWYALPRLTGNTDPHGGISCHEVMAHAREYLAGTLAAGIVEKIEVHLGVCENCSRAIEEMRTSAAGPAETALRFRIDPIESRTPGIALAAAD